MGLCGSVDLPCLLACVDPCIILVYKIYLSVRSNQNYNLSEDCSIIVYLYSIQSN